MYINRPIFKLTVYFVADIFVADMVLADMVVADIDFLCGRWFFALADIVLLWPIWSVADMVAPLLVIGTYTRPTQQCHFEWPRVIFRKTQKKHGQSHVIPY